MSKTIYKEIEELEPLTETEIKQLENLENLEDVYDEENPPLTPEQLKQFKVWYECEWNKNKEFYKPQKKEVHIRLDIDIIEKFKATGKGYQSRINAALREYISTHVL